MGLSIIIILIVLVVAILIMGLVALFSSNDDKKSATKGADSKNGATSDEDKEKKEGDWEDVNEKIKFVCEGGQVQCKNCNTPISDIKVTSTDTKLQDKPWATDGDNDGLINFNFTGLCNHPLQQKPGSPPPPCKLVINLGQWNNVSEAGVDDNNALLVQSTIPCMAAGGEELEIVDSGQQAEVTDVEPTLVEPTETLVSIDLLEGADVKTGTVIQYVNIKPDVKYIDAPDIPHIDRMGQKLRLKVKFDKAGAFRFTVKLTPGPTNVSYTANETTRNTNFKYCTNEVQFTTDANGEKIIDANKIFVTPAGGDTFTITAKDDHGNEVTAAATVKTERMMYYIEAKMDVITGIASNLSVFTSEYNSHNIKFKGLSSFNIAHIENIGSDTQRDTFLARIKTAYTTSTGPAKNPYCIVIAYTDHLAVKDANKKMPVVAATGGGAAPIPIPITDAAGKKHALWNNIVTGEGWFVECYFIKTGGTLAHKVNIEEAKCTAVQSPTNSAGYFNSVNVDVSSLPAVAGTITLKVNWVNRMRAGISLGSTNVVAICTKAWWRNQSEARQNQVIIHELGHQLGMVSNGSGKLPAKTSYHYNTTKGHVGDHCHYDIAAGQARYDSTADGTNSKCVMYGATNGKSAFCVECIKAVKKVDLVSGVKI